jgi:4-hydroxybenzoate polyprenyltransferase
MTRSFTTIRDMAHVASDVFTQLKNGGLGGFRFLWRHMYTVYLFSCNNINDTIIPGLLFASLNASIAPRLAMGPAISLVQILRSFPAILLWSWSHLLFFNISNQQDAAAITEDRLNKPWRPLATGRVTPSQAAQTMQYMHPLILLLSIALGGLGPGLTIVTLTFLYNDGGGSANPWAKNLINGPAMVSFLAGPLEVATGHSVLESRIASVWLLLLVGAIATTCHMQDFRDVEGDRAAGRKTLPIAIGDAKARALAAVGITGWTVGACLFWGAGGMGLSLAATAGTVLMGNMLWDRTRVGDRRTWKLFPFWMLGLYLLPLWLEV